MNARRFRLYEEIDNERAYQDKKWGGPEHDDTHSQNDWIAYIVRFLGRTTYAAEVPTNFRICMVKVAAVAVAAIESYDRKRVGLRPFRGVSQPDKRERGNEHQA